MITELALPVQALVWGAVAGGALLIGASTGYFIHIPQRVTAAIMAFGTGVLISALAFNLMDDAVEQGGIKAAALGFALGVLFYSSANAALSFFGARHRKRSRPRPPHPNAAETASAAIALGALLDGVPESAAIGASLLGGEGVALVTVFAIFISNVPEGLSSAAGMRHSGRKAAYVFGVWGMIALASTIASWAGYTMLGGADPVWVAGVLAFAAGAILVMIIQTMIPESFEETHGLTGPIAAVGFLLAFAASHLAF